MNITSTWLDQPLDVIENSATAIHPRGTYFAARKISNYIGIDPYQVFTNTMKIEDDFLVSEQTATTLTDCLQIAPTNNLSKKASKILGFSGSKRFESFKDFTDGWGNGKGKPLSSYSVAMTELFLNTFEKYIKVTPSIFLAYNGNLQLAWEDEVGGKIEVELAVNKIEYYVETKDKEGFVDLKNIDFYKSLEKLVA